MTQERLRPFRPTDIDWLVEQHQYLYTRDEGFDDSFGPLVRGILDDFASQQNPNDEAGWIAVSEAGLPLGSIFCVRAGDQIAKLRLFFLVPEARGLGLGHLLLKTCMQFARDTGYARMVLWTHESHRAACALYERAGWKLKTSKPVTSFGVALVEQHWEIDL